MPLLDIRNLTIEFKTGEGWVKAVDRPSALLQETQDSEHCSHADKRRDENRVL